MTEAEAMAVIDAAIDEMTKDWQEVDDVRLGGIVVSAKSFFVAAEALRREMRKRFGH